MALFLYSNLCKLLKNIFSVIIRPDAKNNYETALMLTIFQLKDSVIDRNAHVFNPGSISEPSSDK